MSIEALLYASAPGPATASLLMELTTAADGSLLRALGGARNDPDHPGISAGAAARLWSSPRSPQAGACQAASLSRDPELLDAIARRDGRVGVLTTLVANPALPLPSLDALLTRVQVSSLSYEISTRARPIIMARVHASPMGLGLLDQIRPLTNQVFAQALVTHPGMSEEVAAALLRCEANQAVLNRAKEPHWAILSNPGCLSFSPELLLELARSQEPSGHKVVALLEQPHVSALPTELLLHLAGRSSRALELLLDGRALAPELVSALLDRVRLSEHAGSLWAVAAHRPEVSLAELSALSAEPSASSLASRAAILARLLPARFGDDASAWRLALELSRSATGSWEELLALVEAALADSAASSGRGSCVRA